MVPWVRRWRALRAVVIWLYCPRVEWSRERLDDLPGDLTVTAHRLASSDQGANYRFELSHQGQSLLQGQAVVALRD